MKLETKNKKIELVFTTRKLVSVVNLAGGKNFEDLYFKAVNNNDLKALSQIIYSFAEDEAGIKSFKNSEEVYEFIDDYKEENEKTYQDIFEEIAGVINKEGFFKAKMTEEELQEKMSGSLSNMNMNEILPGAVEKAVAKVAEQEIMKEEFRGYKG